MCQSPKAVCCGYFYHKEILTDIGKAVIAIGRSEGIISQVALFNVNRSLQAFSPSCNLQFNQEKKVSSSSLNLRFLVQEPAKGWYQWRDQKKVYVRCSFPAESKQKAAQKGCAEAANHETMLIPWAAYASVLPWNLDLVESARKLRMSLGSWGNDVWKAAIWRRQQEGKS